MARFIDQHPMKPFKAEQLIGLHKMKADEFGVTHHDIIYSETENKIWCIIDAPNKEAVRKHHEKAGVKPDFIIEVKTTA